MRFDSTQITHLTNGEITFCGNGGEGVLQLNQYAKAESYEFTLSPNIEQELTGFF
jgi:hypothetical protein